MPSKHYKNKQKIKQLVAQIRQNDNKPDEQNYQQTDPATIKPNKQTRYYYSHKDEILKKTRSKNQVYKITHKGNIVKAHKQYNTEHNEQIREKQKTYNTLHNKQITQRQKTYDALHKDLKIKRQRQYDLEHKEHKLKKQKQYDLEHKEKIVKKQKQYNLKNQDKIVKKQKQYNIENQEIILGKQKLYNMCHKQNINRKQKRYNLEHRDQINKKRKIHYSQNRDDEISKQRRYNYRHRQVINLKRNIRYFLNKQTVADYSTAFKNLVRRRIKTRTALNLYTTNTALIDQFYSKITSKSKANRPKGAHSKIKYSELAFLINHCNNVIGIGHSYYRYINNKLKNVIDDARENINKLKINKVSRKTILKVFGGKQIHTKHSEPYFVETSYNQLSSKQRVIAGTEVLFLHGGNKLKKYFKKNNEITKWPCSITCKISDPIIACVLPKLENLLNKKVNVAIKILGNTCSQRVTDKKGHTLHCASHSAKPCGTTLQFVSELAVHYSAFRNIKKQLYAMRNLCNLIIKLTSAINRAQLKSVYQFLKKLKLTLKRFNVDVTKYNKFIPNTSCETDEINILNKYKKNLNSITNAVSKFPVNSCEVCNILQYSENLKDFVSVKKKANKSWNIISDYIKQRNQISELVGLKICEYCTKKLNENIIPGRASLNNLEVDPIPEELCSLNIFETMLTQLAKSFQCVIRLQPKRKKVAISETLKGLKGRVTYLPLPLQPNVNMLPEELPENHEVVVLVNGEPTKNRVIWQDLVSANKIYSALKTLKEINPFYKNITFNVQRISDACNQLPEDKYLFKEVPGALMKKVNRETLHKGFFTFHSLHPINMKAVDCSELESYQMQHVTGEHLSVFDKNLDYLTFPQLFPKGRFGKFDCERKFPITDAEYRKTRILNKDGRFRRDPCYLFHLLNDSEFKYLGGAIAHLLNTRTFSKFTVKDILTKVTVNDEQLEAQLSNLFSSLRGTKEYWQRRRQELNAMVRDFGAPTFFLTLSNAEYDCSELLQYIRDINKDVPNVTNMSSGELCALDPTSVCRYYHRLIRNIFKFLINAKINPVLGSVEHYFWRVEYQERGAPHYHMLLWIADSPEIDKDSPEKVADFINAHICAKLPDPIESPQLNSFVRKYQTHVCNSYCLRKYRVKNKYYTRCRFGYPRRVTDNLIINDILSTIASRVKNFGPKRVYDLPRNRSEVRINDYNPVLLLASGGFNMDIQYIKDGYCRLIVYVTSYISKSEKTELEDLWADICKESNKKALWSLGLKKLTNRQIGLYETIDRLLGHHLYGKSEDMRYVSTTFPENRKRSLKSFKDLQNMDSRSTDVFLKSWVDDHYPNRPESLENLNLYDFCRFHDICKVQKPTKEHIVLKNKVILRKRNKPYVIQHPIYKTLNTEQHRNKYYHSLLLLFKPWRKECDILGEFTTYQEAFEHHAEDLKGIMAYHDKLVMIEEGIKELQHKITNFDEDTFINLDQDNIVREVQDADAAMLEVCAAMGKEESADQKFDLNADQRRIFDKIISVLNQQNENQLKLFVSGVGGTGKSYLLRAVKSWINKNFPPKKDSVSVAITAPTGLATYNVNGVTIHRLLLLPVEHGKTPEYQKLNDESARAIRHVLKDLKLLIIDEISLVSSLVFAYIHLRLCEIAKKDEPFGGYNILLFGDLLQLQPVKGNQVFKKLTRIESKSKIGSIGSVDLWSLFEYDELTINVRQQNDKSGFVNTLNNVRTGNVCEEDIALLESRVLINNNLDYVAKFYRELESSGRNPLCLFATKVQCAAFNKIFVELFANNVVTVKSQDELDYNCKLSANKLKNLHSLIDNVSEDVSRTANLPQYLEIFIGAKIMIKRNIDITNGLVNGTIATVSGLNYKQGVVETLDIEINGIKFVLERVRARFQLVKNIYVHRKQFPITLSYAVTIHKSQGLTLNCLLTSLGSEIFAPGMHYVAMSRVTDLNGLYLINFDASKIRADLQAIEEYCRLQSKLLEQQMPHSQTANIEQYCNKFSNIPTTSKQFVSGMLPLRSVPASNDNTEFKIFGLPNSDGVSCYANSVVQCLLHLDSIRKYISKNATTHSFIPGELCGNNILSALLSILNNGLKYKTASTQSLRSLIADFSGADFNMNVQQDAQEFLMFLLNALKCNGSDFKFFDLTIQYIRKCTNCEDLVDNVPLNTELMYYLEFDSENGNKRIAFSDFFQFKPSDLQCGKCGSNNVCIRPRLCSASEFLVLVIKRYQVNRVETLINNFDESNVNIDGHSFKLKSVIYHYGTNINSGHYVCKIKIENSWVLINDDSITTKVNLEPDLKDAYVLFLERT